MHPAIPVGTGPLAPEDVVAVARDGRPVRLTDESVAAMERARTVVDDLAAASTPAYGISTGFGALATRHIPEEKRAQLQRSLVRSHAAGSGPEVEREVVRALMLLRLSTLATGHTGIRVETAQLLADLLSHGITPVVHEYGSLGCSGDLAPLSHCALALMGEGPVRDAAGTLMPAAEALAAAGLAPVELAAKEGLALINGTDGMLGMLVMAIADLRRLLRTADVAAAMSVEGQLGTDRVFAADLQALRPHPGQALSAANLVALLDGSGVVASHRGPDCNRVQDAYSLRCSPQVHGAARDTVEHAALVAGRELASAVDNPVVLPDADGGPRVESNGNFHGAPVGYVLDFLAIVAADVASISERRTDRFLDKSRNHGLPPFLAGDPGVDSGHMIAQYTQAAIVSELKRLAVPGLGRLHPLQRDAGGPRVDGLVGRAQAAALGRRADPGGRGRGAHRRPGARPARPPGAVAGHRRRRPPAARGGHRGPRPRPPPRPRDRDRRRAGPVRCRPQSRRRSDRRAAMNHRLPIHAAHGTALTARSWQTEAPLRMLMNNLDPDNAERPEDLVVYGGTGKAARSWEAYDALVRTLETLGDDETMLVQSGKPVGVMRTHEWAPRVLIANSNLVGDWANWEEFRRLEDLGLTMYGQMTAGSWIYIGTQGILQGTFETFAAIADKRFGGTLAGTITLTAGLGGMGGAQPLAVTMNDGVAICVEVDQARITRRIEHRYLDEQADSVEDAVRRAVAARDERRPLSIGLLGNAAEVFPLLLEMGAPLDIVTDQTSAHDPLSYLPVGVAVEDWADAAARDPDGFTKDAQASMAAHVRAMVELQDAGAEVFDYGNSIRDEARKGGYDRAFEFPGFVPAYIRPLFCEGRGPFRWAALSGDPADIAATDRAILELFPAEESVQNERLHKWITMAGERVAFQGLPARICWLGQGERHLAGLKFNEMVASGELKAPVVIGRDHLDCGSVASPYRETESMLDGSDAIADWALLNALVNTASGATWVSIHHGGGVGMGRSIHAGQVCVADGTDLAAQKIERVLTNDPAMGVIRHVDAGYDRAAEVAAERGVRIPMAEG